MAISKRTKIIILLLAATLFSGLSWAAMVPMWHTPDEQAHFAQVQNTAAGIYPIILEDRTLSTSEDILKSEELLETFRENGNNKFTYHPEYRIKYADGLIGLKEYEIENYGLQPMESSRPQDYRRRLVTHEATGYPPFYYRLMGIVNQLSWSQGLITRVFISRVVTVVLSVGSVWAVFLLVGEVFTVGKRRSFYWAVIVGGLFLFQPMRLFVGSGVTSDAMMNFLYPLGLWRLILLSKKTTDENVWLFVSVGLLGVFTKLQFVFLWLLALPVFLTAVRAKRGLSATTKGLVKMGLLGLPLVLTAVAVMGKLPEISSLVGNVHSLTIWNYLIVVGEQLYRQGFVWYWGVYRWLSLTLPLFSYRVIKLIILAAIFGWGRWGVGIIKRMKTKKGEGEMKEMVDLRSLRIVIASVVIYGGGILIWNYFFWKNKGFSIGLQGRYFFPNLAEHFILLLMGWRLLLPVKWRRSGMKLMVLVAMVFSWYSLWVVSVSYYDASSWSLFWRQASQYKPWFFKMPYLPTIVGLGVFFSGWFWWSLVRYNGEGSKIKG